MNVQSLSKFLNTKFPYKDQQPWDRSGIITTNNPKQVITGILICLDVNDQTIDYALKHNCNLVVSHHPIFIDSDEIPASVKTMTLFERIKRNQISLIALHTNFDQSIKGMNYQIAKKLDFNQITMLDPRITPLVIAHYRSPHSLIDLIANIKRIFAIQSVTYDKKYENLKINSVAIVGGSGFSEIKYLISDEVKVDVFITGDMKWHNWLDARAEDLCVIDVGHGIENIFVDVIYDLLKIKTNIPLFKLKTKLDLINH